MVESYRIAAVFQYVSCSYCIARAEHGVIFVLFVVVVVLCPQYGGVFGLFSSSAVYASDCTFNNNEVTEGESLSSWARHGGGVFYIQDASEAHVSRCTCKGNKGLRGAVFKLELSSTADVVNSELSNNSGAGNGGVAH